MKEEKRKMYVYANGHGLVRFRATEFYMFKDDPECSQLRGEIKLPKGKKNGGGGKWVELDYWFTPSLGEIKKAPEATNDELLGLLRKVKNHLLEKESPDVDLVSEINTVLREEEKIK